MVPPNCLLAKEERRGGQKRHTSPSMRTTQGGGGGGGFVGVISPTNDNCHGASKGGGGDTWSMSTNKVTINREDTGTWVLNMHEGCGGGVSFYEALHPLLWGKEIKVAFPINTFSHKAKKHFLGSFCLTILFHIKKYKKKLLLKKISNFYKGGEKSKISECCFSWG